MKVLQSRLDRGFEVYQNEYEEKALKVLRSGWYVLGEEVKDFEQEFAEYCGAKYCVGLASGLDALWLAFRVLGIGQGDEVIVQGNTYIASVMGITINGAIPVFVEPDIYYNIDADKICEKITDKTKAILVVHLYGQASNMEKIMQIADEYNLRVVEDCAQAHGARYAGQCVGTFGDIGCFSFYPSKNLGGFGEGGAIITSSEQIAEDMRVYRNYGSEKRYYNKVIGTNSRLDEIQAGLLRVRLSHLNSYNAEREKIANIYSEKIQKECLVKPLVRENATSVWHQYVIRVQDRERLQNYLNDMQIGTLVHYPIPPHLAEAYAYMGYQKGAFPITEYYAEHVLSLPIYAGMTEEEQDYVIDVLDKWQ